MSNDCKNPGQCLGFFITNLYFEVIKKEMISLDNVMKMC